MRVRRTKQEDGRNVILANRTQYREAKNMGIIRESADGIEIRWSDGSRLVPLLTREEVERFWPRVETKQKEWRDGTDTDAITLPLEIIHAAMSRNYRGITIADLEDNLTSTTLKALWHALWAATYLYHAPVKSSS